MLYPEEREMDKAMNIDWTINVGHILTFVGFMFGGVIAAFMLKQDVKILALRLSAVEENITKLSNGNLKIVEVLTTIARQDEKISSLEKRIEDLRWSPRPSLPMAASK